MSRSSRNDKYGFRWKIDPRDALARLGVNVEQVHGSHASCWCPLPDHKEAKGESKSISFSIALNALGELPPGVWMCRGCDAKGDIIKLWSLVKGMPYHDAAMELAGIYDPTGKYFEEAARAERLPTPEEIKTYCALLQEDGEALLYWTSARAWTHDWIKRANIGQFDGKLRIPIYDADGRLVNVQIKSWRPKHRKKLRTLAGHPQYLYPLVLFDPDQEMVICEGVPDAGALHSIGVNALTHTGGAGALQAKNFAEWVKRGEGSRVTIVTDNDRAGREAVGRLKRELIESGVAAIRHVKVPEEVNDVEEYFRLLEPSMRVEAWRDLVAKAHIYTHGDSLGFGLWVDKGCIVDDESEEIAPFTGRVLATGRERYGQGQSDDDPRSFTFELIHKSGPTITFSIITGESFLNAVLNAGGPDWSFMRRHEELLFHGICRATASEADMVDTGFMFGFDRDNLETFWAPGISFASAKPFETETKMRMTAPTAFFKLLGLPVPEPHKATEALDLVLNHLMEAHTPHVMGMMLATAFAAPVRRLIMPTEQAFSVMIYGQSGSGKTSRAREVMNLFSGRILDDAMLETWKSTAMAIQSQCSLAGDIWFLVDELRLVGLPSRQRHELLAILQGIAQGSGRASLTRERELRRPTESRCVLAATMEVLPYDDDSQLARSIIIHVPIINLLDDQWKVPHDHVRENRDLLPYAMSAWIHWLVCEQPAGYIGPSNLDTLRKDVEKTCIGLLDQHWPDWRSVANSPRVMQRSIMVTMAWLLLLDLATAPQYQAITESRKDELTDRWFDTILPSYYLQMFNSLKSAGVVECFFAQLNQGLQCGDCALVWIDRMGEITNRRVPIIANANSKIVGMIHECAPGTEDAMMYNGMNVRLLINQAAATASSSQGTKYKWRDLKQVLENYKLLSKLQPRVTQFRGLWLNKKTAEMVLSQFSALPQP